MMPYWPSRCPLTNLERELRLAAAIKLFELGRLSSGAAARLAGMPRTLFLSKLANYGVDTFCLTEEDLRVEATLRVCMLLLTTSSLPPAWPPVPLELPSPSHQQEPSCPSRSQELSLPDRPAS